MTDTPRTRDELLTDFADNQNHGITAQKMRNFVVSTLPQEAGHFAAGADASIDEVLSGYATGSDVLVVAEEADTETDYDTGGLDTKTGVFARLDYTRAAGFTSGFTPTETYPIHGEFNHRGSAAARVLAAGVFGAAHVYSGAAVASGALVQGLKGEANVHSGAPMPDDLAGVHNAVSLLGSGSVSGRAQSIVTSTFSQRTGGDFYGARITSPLGPGVRTNQYGLYVEDHPAASASGNAYNIFSAGAASKNKLEGQLLVAGHSAFGNEGEIDREPVEGLLTYAHAPSVVYAYETTDLAPALPDTAAFGVYSILEYDRSTPFGAAGMPALIGGSCIVEFSPTAGATGSDFNDGVFGMYNGVLHSGAIEPGWIQGELATVSVEDGAVGVTGGIQVLQGFANIVGTSPTDPGDIDLISSGIFTQRSGAYNVYGFHAFAPSGGGTPAGQYGVYVEAQTLGTSQSWNIFSAGTTSKNKFQGRVFQGTPNSAPTDADIDNGMVTAYLDQAGNALKFRVKYSDGTLKTGSVTLS